nr:immunoglobulin heavy chain junction region [Macaca mulatta]MOV90628.1 immunoglobulin heavy chain junction region [Macaca mulatta]
CARERGVIWSYNSFDLW